MFIYHCLFTLVLKSPNGEWPITYTYIFCLSHTDRQMQEKTNRVKVNRGKTKVLKIKTTITEPARLGDDLLEEVDSFTYLGSVVEINGGHRS